MMCRSVNLCLVGDGPWVEVLHQHCQLFLLFFLSHFNKVGAFLHRDKFKEKSKWLCLYHTFPILRCSRIPQLMVQLGTVIPMESDQWTIFLNSQLMLLSHGWQLRWLKPCWHEGSTKSLIMSPALFDLTICARGGGVLNFGLYGSMQLEPQNPYSSQRIILAKNDTHF